MNYRSLAYCSKCKVWEAPLIKNATRVAATKSYGQCTTVAFMCRECTNSRYKSYYHRNKKKVRAIIYRSIKKHSHKQSARMKLKNALASGAIIKPAVCEVCSEAPSRIEGHHHDYSKPLEVTWLCTGCHADADKLQKLK